MNTKYIYYKTIGGYGGNAAILMYLVHGTCIFHIVIVFETYNIKHIKKKTNIYTCLYNSF